MSELERVEAQALRDAVVLGGGRAGMAGGAMCFMHPRVAVPELNRAIPLGTHVDVAAILDWFDGHPHGVCVPAGYLGLDQALTANGYKPAAEWMKFRRGDAPAAAAPTELRIEQTLDGAAFMSLVGDGTDMQGFVGAPGWLHFLAWDGDEPAGAGALYADGEHAWVGVGVTRPDQRGRGAQSGLLAARIEAGRALGVKQFTTETGNDRGTSYRNILRAGFEEAYPRPNWRSPS